MWWREVSGWSKSWCGRGQLFYIRGSLTRGTVLSQPKPRFLFSIGKDWPVFWPLRGGCGKCPASWPGMSSPIQILSILLFQAWEILCLPIRTFTPRLWLSWVRRQPPIFTPHIFLIWLPTWSREHRGNLDLCSVAEKGSYLMNLRIKNKIALHLFQITHFLIPCEEIFDLVLALNFNLIPQEISGV